MIQKLAYEELVKDFTWEEALQSYDSDPNQTFNIAHECCDRFSKDPDHVAIYWENQSGKRQTWTFAQLKEKSDQLANSFRSLGVTKGDRVACLLGKDIELVLTALATLKIGAVYVPLFTAFGPEAIAHRLSVSGSKMLVTNQEQMKKVNNISLVEQIFVIDDDTPPAHNFWEQLENASNHFETEKTTLIDPSIIQFTSGSTGMPKGAVWGHKILLSVYPYTKYALGLNSNDIFFGGADPGWAYGFFNSIISPLSFGVPIIIYKGGFDVKTYYDLK